MYDNKVIYFYGLIMIIKNKNLKKVCRLTLFLFVSVILSETHVIAQSSSPRAGERITVLFLPIQTSYWVSENIAKRLEEYFQAILDINTSIKLIEYVEKQKEPEPEKPKEEPPPAPPPEQKVKMKPELEKANQSLWEGKEALEKKDLIKASKLFQESRKLYMKNLPDLEDFEMYIDSCLQLAISFFMGGYNEDGYDALDHVLQLRPGLSIDRKNVPPALVNALDRLLAKAEKRQLGDIVIEVSEADATLFMDGILIGTGSQTIKDPPKGRHFLRVRKDGFKPFTQFFTSPGKGSVVNIKAKLVPEVKISEEKKEVKKVAPKSGVSILEYVMKGDFDTAFIEKATEVAKEYNTGYITFGYCTKAEGNYHFQIFLFKAQSGQIISMDTIVMDQELSNLQVALLDLESKVVDAIKKFPANRLVKGKPAIYSLAPPPPKTAKPVPPPPPPVVTKPPVPAPQPQQPQQPQPPPPVVLKPQPAPPAPSLLPEKEAQPAVSEKPRTGQVTFSFEEVPEDFPIIKDEGVWYKKWWVWTIVGSVLVSGGVTAIVLMSKGGGSSSKFSTVVEW
jgi:hypothetical protein